MSLKSKKEALASIKSRERVVKGRTYTIYDVYLGTNDLTKKAERLYANSKSELESDIAEFYKSRSVAGDFATVLTAEQIIDARNALYLLSEAKVGISLSECAKREIERFSVVSACSKTLGDAYDEFLKSKKDDSPLEINKTRGTTGRWVESIGRDRILADITTAEVVEYIRTYFDSKSPKTYNAHVSYIRTFIGWCTNVEQAYIKENFMTGVKLRKVQWKKPEYLKVEHVKKLFEVLSADEVKMEHPEYLALAVTQFFVGVRREEALRIATNSNTATIHLEDETFRVDGGKGYTKGKAPRAAHIQPNAIAWMKSFDYLGALKKIGKYTTDEYYELARKHDIPVFINCARHTFITMHVAKFHTPEVTQAMVGTSGTMRAAHYDGLASQKEGESYFAIFPESVSPSSGIEPSSCA